jgi:hypothetical protein
VRSVGCHLHAPWSTSFCIIGLFLPCVEAYSLAVCTVIGRSTSEPTTDLVCLPTVLIFFQQVSCGDFEIRHPLAAFFTEYVLLYSVIVR